MNLQEEIQRLQEIMGIDEMAYPADFNMQEFMSIRSFAGRLKYAQQHLLGRVGSGSARAVFRVDDEKVIKVAMNQKGLAQNDAEGEWYKQNYEVLARVFDTDDENTWIEMELAKKISPNRFKELTGTTPDEVSKWVANLTGLGRTHFSNIPDLSENEFAESLANFVGDYGYQIPGDFSRISSYGEVLRDGKPTVVVIDFGYDSNTDDIYMAAQQKASAKRGNRS